MGMSQSAHPVKLQVQTGLQLVSENLSALLSDPLMICATSSVGSSPKGMAFPFGDDWSEGGALTAASRDLERS